MMQCWHWFSQIFKLHKLPLAVLQVADVPFLDPATATGGFYVRANASNAYGTGVLDVVISLRV